MTITKVSYGKTYPLGNYSSERIDLEASVEDGERITGVIELLKEICDREHKANNPHLYQEQETIIEFGRDENNNLTRTEKTPQPIDNTPKKLSQKELIQQEIEKCTTIKQVEEWKILSDKDPETKKQWCEKYDQLTNTIK